MAVYEAKFICEVLEDTDVDVIRDDWESALKSKRAKILSEVTKRIPNTATYVEVLANPAIAEYESYVNPNHPKAQRALRKRKIKLPAAGEDYINNIQNALQEGGAFEQGVTQKKTKFARNFKRITVAVGDKSKKLGAIMGAVWALRGQYSKIQTFPSERYTEIARDAGMPVALFKPAYASNVISAVTQLLNEGLYYAHMADELGETDERDNIISDTNTRLDAFVQNTAFLIDGADAANCFVHIVYEGGDFKVHVKETVTL